MENHKPNGLLPLPLALVLSALVLAGAAAFVLGLATTPARAWAALLVSGFYVLALSLAAALFLVIRTLTGAGWCAVFDRVPGAMVGALPFVAIPFAAVAAGMHHVYHHRHGATGFALRMVAYLALWWWVSRRLVTRRGTAALFALVFAPTFTLASIDWLMAVEPHWMSTLYPWYVFSTAFAGGLAMMTLLVLGAHARGKLPGLSKYHRHDLGKLVFAFSFFWGYLWFCQYMLIWYANIPEEVTHYIARTKGPWMALFAANAIVNLVIPFFALISQHAKKTAPVLAATCALVVAGHWLDVHMLVMPAVVPDGPALTALDAMVALGFASLWLLAVHRLLGSGSIVAEHDPYLQESLAHHGA